MNIDEYIENKFLIPIEKNSNTIGIEIEMPVISKDGIIDMDNLQLLFNEFLKIGYKIISKDNKENITAVCNDENDKISLEYSVNTIEISLGKSKNIYELKNRFDFFYKFINDFIKKFKYELICCGINPNYKKINRVCLDDNYYKTIEKLLKSNTYKNEKLFGEFCSYCCSIQTHIVPKRIYLAKYLNVFNYITDIKENIFANSYMNELNTCNARKVLWHNCNFGNNNIGKLPFLKNEKDIIEMYKNSYLNIISRDNEYIILPKPKLKNYLNLKEINGINIKNEKIKIEPQYYDFDRFRSYRDIELTKYGTIEIRSDCMQGNNNIFKLVAFNVGVSANIEKAYQLVIENNKNFEKWLEIAKEGLNMRNFNEEIILLEE